MSEKEKFSIPRDILEATAIYLQKQPWEEVNQLLAAIQQQVNKLEKCGDTWKEVGVQTEVNDKKNEVPAPKNPQAPQKQPDKQSGKSLGKPLGKSLDKSSGKSSGRPSKRTK